MTPAFTPNAEDGAKRILRARIALTLRLPFLSSALMQIRADAASLPDASPVATDGWRILYDPAQLGRLSDAALAASLFHFKELEIKEVKEYLRREGISVRI